MMASKGGVWKIQVARMFMVTEKRKGCNFFAGKWPLREKIQKPADFSP